jgi:hypothetical protein
MKIKILSILLKEIKETATSEEFKRIEDAILDMAECSKDIKTYAAAMLLRKILNVPEYDD